MKYMGTIPLQETNTKQPIEVYKKNSGDAQA